MDNNKADAMKCPNFVGYFFLVSFTLAAQTPLPDISKLTIQQAQEKIGELEKEISDALASMPALPPRDQFESTSDYNKRNQPWLDMEDQRVKPMRVAQEQLKQQLYLDSSVNSAFVSYDADAEVMTANINGGSCSFKIPKASAREMRDSWSGVSFVHNLAEGGGPVANRASNSTRNPTQPAMALVWGSQLYFGFGGSSPPSVISKVDPQYPGANGPVTLSVVVNGDGKPGDIKVVKSGGTGADEEAIKTVQQWRFKPGRNNCMPAKVRATIGINFRK
jgi:TonB family protein